MVETNTTLTYCDYHTVPHSLMSSHPCHTASKKTNVATLIASRFESDVDPNKIVELKICSSLPKYLPSAQEYKKEDACLMILVSTQPT